MDIRSFFKIFLAVILVVAVILLAIRVRDGMFMASGRRSGPHSRLTRVACGSLGFLLLGIVGFGTWSETHSAYEVKGAGLTIRVPTKAVSVPQVTGPHSSSVQIADDAHKVHLSKSRMLIQMVAAETSYGAVRPLDVKEWDIQWPKEKGPFTADFVLGRLNYKLRQSFVIDSLYYSNARVFGIPGKGPAFYTGGHAVQEFPEWNSSPNRAAFNRPAVSSISGTGGISDPLVETPFSIAQNPFGSGRVCVLYFATPIADDDPLVTQPLSTFLEDRSVVIRNQSGEQPWGDRKFWGIRQHTFTPLRGAALLVHVGAAGILLLVAAVLLTQLWTKRLLAFPMVLAVVVLYVTMLERMVVSVSLAHLSNPAATLTTRLTACEQLRQTFFFRNSALYEMKAIVGDESTPDDLKFLALNNIRLLTNSSTGVPATYSSTSDRVMMARKRSTVTPTFVAGTGESRIQSLALSPDGKMIAAGTTNPDAAVKVWDMKTNRLLASIPNGNFTRSIAFSPNSKLLVIASNSESYRKRSDGVRTPYAVELWDMTATPPSLWRRLVSQSVIRSVSFFKDGQQLLCTGQPQAEIWNLSEVAKGDLPQWQTPEKIMIDNAAVSPDGRTLVCVEMVHTTVTSSGPKAKTTISGGRVYLWDLERPKGEAPKLNRVLPLRQIDSVALSPDGRLMACTTRIDRRGNSSDIKLQMVDVKTGAIIWTRRTEDVQGEVLFSPDGRLLSFTERYHDPGNIIPSGYRVVVCNARTGSDLRSRTEVDYSTFQTTITQARFLPDAKKMAIAQGHEVRLRSLSSFAKLLQ